ncbi:helix-turn-helix transcriptional regulator [Actinomycetaceae bacterium TAE3-ERU4]|nr:helix-turn-helix transcriptional regulator [Actinomycetaceae bacterium TAE3-ERU4]
MEEVLYVISVAAQLAGMHPQTLRQYDRLGLVSPKRTSGRGRRYTPRDVRTLRRVQQLSQEEGINLAGIRRILELEEQLERAQQMLRQVAEAQAERARSAHRVFTVDTTGQVYESRAGQVARLNVIRGMLPPAH